jgi:hypothetical protein
MLLIGVQELSAYFFLQRKLVAGFWETFPHCRSNFLPLPFMPHPVVSPSTDFYIYPELEFLNNLWGQGTE